MLVFCEDCGEKNIVDPNRIKEEKNQYRCSICNFLNTCQPQGKSKSVQKSPKSSTKSTNHLDKKTRTKKVSKTDKQGQAKRRKLNTHEEPYLRVFNKIEAEKEILGAYVYHFYNGLIAYDIDQETTEETMLQIGKAFSVCSPFGHKILKKTKEIYMVLDYQTAVCRNITMNSILVLICKNYPVRPSVTSVFEQSINNLQVFI